MRNHRSRRKPTSVRSPSLMLPKNVRVDVQPMIFISKNSNRSIRGHHIDTTFKNRKCAHKK